MSGHLEAMSGPPGQKPDNAASPGAAPAIIPGLVWAFRIHPDGTADELDVAHSLDEQHDGWLWLHFNLADTRSRIWLADAPGLPDQARAALLGSDRHQQLHTTDRCIYGVIADMVRDLSQITDQVGYLRFAMTERRMITARSEALHATDNARKKLRQGHRLRNVAALFEVVIDQVADAIDLATDAIGTELDEIEDRIVSGRKFEDRNRLGKLRRNAVRLHRQLLGLRSLFHRLERDGANAMSEDMDWHVPRLVQRLDWLDHEVVATRDRARLLQDEVVAKVAEESNRLLKTLTVIGTLLMPPTLITSFFGMNTKDMPFNDVENGTLWAAMLVVSGSLATYLWFRWLSKARD